MNLISYILLAQLVFGSSIIRKLAEASVYNIVLDVYLPPLPVSTCTHLRTHWLYAPLILSVLMFAIPQTRLPPELIHAILMHMKEWHEANSDILADLVSNLNSLLNAMINVEVLS